MDEIWKPITGFEGIYEVSNCGNVRSLDRVIVDSLGRNTYRSGRDLKHFIDKRGYHKVNLHKNNIAHVKFIHRLVAIEFIQNPENLPEVNHKNTQQGCNFVWNLEWCDRQGNMTHAKDNGLITNIAAMEARRRPIICLETSKPYFSIEFCANETGIRKSSIHAVASGKRGIVHGMHFYYITKEEYEMLNNGDTSCINEIYKRVMPLFNKFRPKSNKVRCIETGIEYKSSNDCAQKMGLSESSIYRVARGKYAQHHGYTFEFVDTKAQLPIGFLP